MAVCFLTRKSGSASVTRIWASIQLPFTRIQTPLEFEEGELRICSATFGTLSVPEERERFLHLMYYLLGWMVGDAGKGFYPKKNWARFQLNLCRGHQENLALGNFVMNCITLLGVPWTRIADKTPYENEPHGDFRWQSYYSEVFLWLHVACLGLSTSERTTTHPVRMRWLLSASFENRLWFLRGIADSDGGVNISNKTVEITSEPNATLIEVLLNSLGIQTLAWVSKGIGMVSVRGIDAFHLSLFNPEVESHKSRLLEKIVNAHTFQRHWPEWLNAKVQQFLRDEVRPVKIGDKLLFELNTYTKLKTIKH
jgi:hypothetical protein